MSWKTRKDDGRHFQDLPRGINAATFNKMQQQDKGRSLGYHEKFVYKNTDHTGLTFSEIDSLLALINYIKTHLEIIPEIVSRKENIPAMKKDLDEAHEKLVNGLRTTYKK